jgi:hypothetical protein
MESSPPTAASLKALFTKPCCAPAPDEAQGRQAYADDVHFQDSTQEKWGIAAYLETQERLLKRCAAVYLTPGAVAIEGGTAFVEWEMGLKIKRIEFIYPGTTRLRFNAGGKIADHSHSFDFVDPTFAPAPVVGGFLRWLYKRFVA